MDNKLIDILKGSSALEDNIQTLINTANIIRESSTDYPELKEKLLVSLEDELATMQRYWYNKDDIINYQKELKELGIHEYFIKKLNKL